jgi:hypothetical protein
VGVVPWISAIKTAAELGLIDDPSRAKLLIKCTKEIATTLRTPTRRRQNPSSDEGPAPVQELVGGWRSLHDDRETPKLPLHVVISTQDPRGGRYYVRGVEEVALRVTVTDLEQNMVKPGLGSAKDHWVEDLQRGDTLPLVVLKERERLEIRDRQQLDGVLSDVRPPEFAIISTPDGPQARVWWSTPTSDNPQPRSLHALAATTEAHGSRTDWMPKVQHSPRAHPLRKFIIAAPPFNEGHGGVVALHRLCDRLNAAGYEAYIHPTGPNSEIRPGWRTPLQRGRSINDAVVIYPEVITGNPFNAPRVVRWLLNRPGWFTGKEMESSANDLLVAFSRQIAPTLPTLSVPLIDPTIFFPKDCAGTGALLWIGKGGLPPDFDVSRVKAITRNWPTTRPDLAALLRSADVLYTCDWLTSLIDESLMCATPVVLTGKQSWLPHEIELRPGMSMSEGTGLETARREATTYFPKYQSGLGATEHEVEKFVALVNRHFRDA